MAWTQTPIFVPQTLWLGSWRFTGGDQAKSMPSDLDLNLARRLEDGLWERKNKKSSCRSYPDLGSSRQKLGCLISTYNKLFIIIIGLNVVVIIVQLAYNLRSSEYNDQQPLDLARVSASCRIGFAGNLCASIMVRHDHFINLLYRCLVVHARRAPLAVRRRLAGVYNVGGVHSGCATAAILWYMVGIGFDMTQNDLTTGIGMAKMMMPLLILALLLVIIVSSLPYIRVHSHNSFELVHRFGGWLVLALLWIQMALPWTDSGVNEQQSNSNIDHHWNDPGLWLLTISTALIVYPWLRLRRMRIETRPMSSHAVELSLPLQIQACRTVRVSRSPLIESHSFAAIPDSADPARSSIIVSRAGDWTSRVIDHPPERLWLRETATWGVIRVATLFKSCTIIATGSGIGPCLSLFIGHPGLPCRILWSTKSPVKTYGQAVVDTVMRTDPQAYIIDTSKAGRIDMLQAALSFQLMARSEAVIAISNPMLTRGIISIFQKRGIPAYGPIWDS